MEDTWDQPYTVTGSISFSEAAGRYYNVAKAKTFFATPIPEGYRRWACVLCGCPAGDYQIAFEDVGAFCCRGCGMSCVRPVAELPDHAKELLINASS